MLNSPTPCWTGVAGAAQVRSAVAPGNINGAEGNVGDCAAEIMDGCKGAAGYLNAENAPGVAIPVGLGDPNSGGVLAELLQMRTQTQAREQVQARILEKSSWSG